MVVLYGVHRCVGVFLMPPIREAATGMSTMPMSGGMMEALSSYRYGYFMDK